MTAYPKIAALPIEAGPFIRLLRIAQPAGLCSVRPVCYPTRRVITRGVQLGSMDVLPGARHMAGEVAPALPPG